MKKLIWISLVSLAIHSCVSQAPLPPVATTEQTEYQDFAYYLTWSSDDQLLSATTNTGLYVYDTKTYEQVAVFTGLGGATVEFSSEYMAAINGSSLHVWGLKDYGLLFREESSNPIQFQSVSISPDGKWLVTGEQKQFRLWNLPDGKVIAKFPVDGFISNLAFTDDNNLIVIEQYKAEIQEWDLQDQKMTHSFEIPRDVIVFTLGRDGKVMLVDYGESGVEMWNVETGKPKHYYRQMQGAEWWTRLSGNNQIAVVWGYAIDGDHSGMGVWDLDDDKRIQEFSTSYINGDGWRCGALNFDGSVLAASDNEGYIHFYNIASGEEFHKLYLPYKFE